MQKILRRTAQVKNQNARRKATQKSKLQSANRKLRVQEQTIINETIRSDIFAARKARREDWQLGNLAPRRDAGDQEETYGTVSKRRLNGVKKMEDERIEWCLKAGDRVVVVKEGHRDRGKIGTIDEVRHEAQECVVSGINKVDIALPSYMLLQESDKRPIRTMPAPIPMADVRLVYPLPDSQTGERRDVVIKQLQPWTTWNDIRRGNPPRRKIAGISPRINIPYPAKEEPDHAHNDIDTLRIEVEEKTFVPTLFERPMPKTVINELRNMHTKYKDRFTEEFVARKTAEDEAARKEKAAQMKAAMRTPMQQLAIKERRKRRRRGWPGLDQDSLARIGEVMAASTGRKRLRKPDAETEAAIQGKVLRV